MTATGVDVDYLSTLDALSGLCRGLRTLPLDAALRTCGNIEALAPILEPTAYRRGGAGRLRDQRRLLEAAIRFRDLVEQLAPGT